MSRASNTTAIPRAGRNGCRPGTSEFARSKGRGWLVSDDWGETGKPVDAQTAQRLNNWVGLIDGKLNAEPALEFVTTKNEGEREQFIYKEAKSQLRDGARFTFGKYKGEKSETPPLLSEISGPMQLGARVATVTVRFSYLVAVNLVESKDASAPAKSARGLRRHCGQIRDRPDGAGCWTANSPWSCRPIFLATRMIPKLRRRWPNSREPAAALGERCCAAPSDSRRNNCRIISRSG
jgi:hypothetical protein